MVSKFHSNRLNAYSANHFGRTNRRKTSKARHTQVIDVPKYIVKEGLNALQEATVKRITKNKSLNKSRYPNLFVLNPSPFAGRRKFIFHDRPTTTA